MVTEMNVNEREKELFSRWGKGRAKFVVDGVLNEKAYEASSPKTVFVLKEPTGGPGDLRDTFQKPVGQTWWKAARILHAIRQIGATQERFQRKMHPSICAFNLNKVGGNKSTDMPMLALLAMKDAQLIAEQFGIYDADLTLCAGTFDIFRYVLGHENIETAKTSGGMPWYKIGAGRYVLGIKHTGDRGRKTQSVENVIDAIKEIGYTKTGDTLTWR